MDEKKSMASLPSECDGFGCSLKVTLDDDAATEDFPFTVAVFDPGKYLKGFAMKRLLTCFGLFSISTRLGTTLCCFLVCLVLDTILLEIFII